MYIHARDARARRATYTLTPLKRKRAALRRFFVCAFSPFFSFQKKEPFFSFQKKETESTSPAVLPARVPDRISDRVDVASAVVVRRATLARAVVSARRAHSRIRERLTAAPPGYDCASPSRPESTSSPSPLSRPSGVRRTSAPGARHGDGLGTCLRDERHVHRVRLGRPPRRAPARACELAPRAPRRARSGSRRRARPRDRAVGRDETRRRDTRVSFGIGELSRGAARRACSRRARPRRSRVGGGV